MTALIGTLLIRSWFPHLLFQTKLIISMQRSQMMSGMTRKKRWRKQLSCFKMKMCRKCSTGIILTGRVSFPAWFKKEEILCRGKNRQEQQSWSTQVYYNHPIKQKLQPQITHLIIPESPVRWTTLFFLNQNLNLLQQDNTSNDPLFNSRRMRTSLPFQGQSIITLEDHQENSLREINLV